MDKLRNNPALASLTKFFRGKNWGEGSVNLLWRTLLGVTFLLAIVLGAFAFVTYQWATEVPVQPPLPKIRSTFSVDELREVITLYQKKSDDFKQLEQSRPDAPPLDGVTQ